MTERRRNSGAWLGVLLVVVLLVLAGCAGQQDVAEAPQEKGFQPALDPNTKGSVKIVGHYSNFESLEAEFDRFAAYYPNIELSYTYLDAYNDTIVPALSGSDTPDIYCTFPWMVGRADWSALFEAAEDLSDSSLGIDLGCVRPGLLYRDENDAVPMVPVLATTYGMLINEDLLAREGVDVPSTYEELLAACDSLREAGYPSPLMGYNDTSGMWQTLTYPLLCGSLEGDANAVKQLNALEDDAGSYTRPALELVDELMRHECIDLDTCASIGDNYEQAILRFFEGDVPMLLATGDIVSGTGKRESLSEAFTQDPFAYSFHPFPATSAGGYFLDSTSMAFSVNKDSQNLDVANEFMRFLVSTTELNEMASVKRLLTTSVDLTFDGLYASLADVDISHIVSMQKLGLRDVVYHQMRNQAFLVGNGEATVDEAEELYGTFEE